MHILSIFLSYALLLVSMSMTLVSGLGCESTIRPFKLYASSSGTNGTSILNVVQVDSNKENLIFALTADTASGQTPDRWALNNSILSPILLPPAPTSRRIVDRPLTSGQVQFITETKPGEPIYCAKSYPTSDETTRKLLSVQGHTDLFSLCNNLATQGPAYRRDLYYNMASANASLECRRVILTIEEIY